MDLDLVRKVYLRILNVQRINKCIVFIFAAVKIQDTFKKPMSFAYSRKH